MSHILLNQIIPFKKNVLDNPTGYKYHIKSGWWVADLDETEVLVKSDKPGRPIRGTKKQDVETGEDQKGQ